MLDIFHSDLTRARLCDGARVTASIAGATLGPCGSPVIVGDPRAPTRIARTGHAAASSVQFVDRAEAAGALVLQQVARWTIDAAGDGTASAIAVASVLTREIVNSTRLGFSPVSLSAGVEDAVGEAKRHLDELTRPAETADLLRDVATTAAGCRQLGSLVVEAALPGAGGWMALIKADHVGQDARIDTIPGISVGAGYVVPHLVTHCGRRRSRLRIEGPLVLIADRKLENEDELALVLDHASRAHLPLVIFARAFSARVASTLVRRLHDGSPHVIPIAIPNNPMAPRLADVAAATDASIVPHESSANLTAAHLGEARTILIDERRTLIFGFTSQSAVVGSTLPQLCVGANTREIASDRQVRAERAALAIHAASRHGVVPGGGVALLSAAKSLSVLGFTQRVPERRLAYSIVQRALEEPFRILLQNAGISPRKVLHRVRRRDAEDCAGVTLPSGEIVDVRAAGILDSATTVQAILYSAELCARLLLAGEQLAAGQRAPTDDAEEGASVIRGTFQ